MYKKGLAKGVAVAAVAIVWLAPFGTAAASTTAAGAAITKVGWWTRNPAGAAPEDGFNVANAADGPLSVAAIQVASATALESATLILTEEGGIQTDSAKLQVCTTPNEWTAGGAQPWEAAPKAECDGGAVELVRNAPSASWGAEVTSLLGDIEDEGIVSLMIVPSGDATVPIGFEVRFQKPQLNSQASTRSSTDSDFSSSGSSDLSSSGDDFSSSDDSTTSPSGSSSAEFASAPTGSSFSPSAFDAPTAAIAPAAPTAADGAAGVPVDATGAPAGTDASSAEVAALPSQAAVGVTTSGGNHTLQALVFVVIATIAGVGAGLGRWFVRRRSDDASAFA